MNLVQKTNYVMGTLSLRERFRAMKLIIRQKKFPKKAGILAIVMEGLIFIIAFFLSRLKSKTPGSWNVIKITKRSVPRSKNES